MDEKLATSIWERKFNSLLIESNIPSKYYRPQVLVPRSIDIEAWEYLDEVRNEIVESVENGLNIVISSRNVGNGKTSWAARLLQRYLAETALDGRMTYKGRYVNCSSLLSSLRDFNYLNTDVFKHEFTALKECDLLVLDELGSGMMNKVSYPYFYELINYRVDHQLSTVSTTNYAESELLEYLGERLFSRIYDTATVVEFLASNVRGYEPDEIKEAEA